MNSRIAVIIAIEQKTVKMSKVEILFVILQSSLHRQSEIFWFSLCISSVPNCVRQSRKGKKYNFQQINFSGWCEWEQKISERMNEMKLFAKQKGIYGIRIKRSEVAEMDQRMDRSERMRMKFESFLLLISNNEKFRIHCLHEWLHQIAIKSDINEVSRIVRDWTNVHLINNINEPKKDCWKKKF